MSTELSKFLENLFPIPLHHRKPKSSDNPWVFWSQNNLSSADRGTPINMIHEKIISAFYKTETGHTVIGQFWAPVTIGGRRVLSTSGQPFAVSYPSKDFAMYRLYSSSYKYDIDPVNKRGTQGDHMIMSGGHSAAFLNCLPYMDQVHWIPTDESTALDFSIMLPICFPSQSQSYCIGVLEFTLGSWPYYLEYFLLNMIDTLKNVGLDLFRVEKLIPYKTLSYLTPTKDKIEEALKIVCGSHNLALAQVWVTNENKNYMPFSSSLDDTRTKGLALKLTGRLGPVTKLDIDDFQKYYTLCDVIPHGFGEEVAAKTLQDYESRYISKLYSNMVVDWDRQCSDVSALAICLRSIETGHFDYTFEFIWIKHSNYVIFLEALLLSLKRCLPGFKFASGAELGDEFDVIDVQTYAMDELDETDESEKLKIFQGKKSPPMPKSLVVDVDNITSSEAVCCKTTPKVLPREVIEKQFGKTMKEAAKNLHVSRSTLKRKLRKHGIPKWPGPNFVKKKTNDLSAIIQIDTSEEDNRLFQEQSTININQNTLTIKAEYADDMIKFSLPILQATFAIVEKEISIRFMLSLGTYKLKYRDEVGDWILLTSDEEMSYCISGSRKLDSNEVRLCVIPSTQTIFGPSCSYGISST